jgi:hypothetical protein
MNRRLAGLDHISRGVRTKSLALGIGFDRAGRPFLFEQFLPQPSEYVVLCRGFDGQISRQANREGDRKTGPGAAEPWF